MLLRAVELLIKEVQALRVSVEQHRASVDTHTTSAQAAVNQGFWSWAQAKPVHATVLGFLVILALQGQASQIIHLLATFLGSGNARP
jgi:hypothetical protein